MLQTEDRIPVPEAALLGAGNHAGPSRGYLWLSPLLLKMLVFLGSQPLVRAVTCVLVAPSLNQHLALLWLQGRGGNEMPKSLGNSWQPVRDQKSCGFTLPLGDPTSHCGAQALLLHHCCRHPEPWHDGATAVALSPLCWQSQDRNVSAPTCCSTGGFLPCYTRRPRLCPPNTVPTAVGWH